MPLWRLKGSSSHVQLYASSCSPTWLTVKTLLSGDVAQAQAVLKRLIAGRLTFHPQADGSYRFKGTGTVEPVIGGR